MSSIATDQHRERERESAGGLDRSLSHQHQQDDRGGDRAAIERLRSCAARSLPLATHRRGARSLSLSRSLEAPSHTPTPPRPPAVLLVITLTLSSSLFVVGWVVGWQQQVGAARGLCLLPAPLLLLRLSRSLLLLPDTALCL